MDVFNAVGSFVLVPEPEAEMLSGSELLMAYDNARSSHAQLEILGTPHERIAGANLVTLRTEVLRRLDKIDSK